MGKASDNEADGLLGALYEDVEKERSMDLLLKTFLPAKPNKGTLTVDAFPHKSFRDLFLRFNTQIPFSAGVERMFSLGKDVFIQSVVKCLTSILKCRFSCEEV